MRNTSLSFFFMRKRRKERCSSFLFLLFFSFSSSSDNREKKKKILKKKLLVFFLLYCSMLYSIVQHHSSFIDHPAVCVCLRALCCHCILFDSVYATCIMYLARQEKKKSQVSTLTLKASSNCNH